MAITFVNLIVSSEIIHTVCGVNVLYKTSWIDFGILRERFIKFSDIQILKIKNSHLTVSSRDESFVSIIAYMLIFHCLRLVFIRNASHVLTKNLSILF